jgi:hypothetical protein
MRARMTFKEFASRGLQAVDSGLLRNISLVRHFVISLYGRLQDVLSILFRK